MSVILCYGDSNTWGYVPGSGERYSINQRWPGILQKTLGNHYHIIEEGLNGRTTVWDDPFKPGRNGLTSLIPIMDSHRPIDLVILMLGTNDLKHYRFAYAADSARGASKLVETINKTSFGPSGLSPYILLVSPPLIGILSPSMQLEYRDASTKSQEFSQFFRQISDEMDCFFLDASDVTTPSDIDGVHLDEFEHRKLALAIADTVMDFFNTDTNN